MVLDSQLSNMKIAAYSRYLFICKLYLRCVSGTFGGSVGWAAVGVTGGGVVNIVISQAAALNDN